MLNLLNFVFKVYCIYSLEKGPVILLMMTVLLSLDMTKKCDVLVVQGDRANKCVCVGVWVCACVCVYVCLCFNRKLKLK